MSTYSDPFHYLHLASQERASYGVCKIKAKFRRVAEYLAHVVGWSEEYFQWRSGKDDRTNRELEDERNHALMLVSYITDAEWKLICDYWIHVRRMGNAPEKAVVQEWIRKIELLRAFR